LSRSYLHLLWLIHLFWLILQWFPLLTHIIIHFISPVVNTQCRGKHNAYTKVTVFQLGTEPRAWHVPGKCSATELHLQSPKSFFSLSLFVCLFIYGSTGVWTQGFVLKLCST
jgi:hypothetical protein